MGIEKVDTEIRKEQIAQAALSIIATRGMRGLSVARVAKKVGIVPSGIYRHFKNKDQMIKAVFDLIEDMLLGNVTTVCLETADSIERLRLLLLRHIRLLREIQAIPRMVFSDEVSGGEPGKKAQAFRIIKRYLDKVAVIIYQGQKEGVIRPGINPEVAAVMFLGLIQPAAVLWHLSEGAFDAEKHAEKAWQVFRTALETRAYEG
jgi:AcrR family transcriptional regulator